MTTPSLRLGGLSPRWWWAAAGGAGVAALGYLATHDPNEPGHYPGCFLLATTGLYCPACGGTRATYDLLHGDVTSAFARNPMVPPLYLAVALVVAYHVVRRRLGHRTSTDVPPWLPVAIGVLVLLFGVVRNLPGMEALSPA
ncbi:DUF2752 domain-containing protein [Phycicoccus flavus]|uniref:DUF2752 domain-containing protein n=1 Tax=Phycicoccus flavus TaxID=2502783 RepID=UPI000FEB663C|nr:DUF2752 domain-containing protein [Phycicoccus flavus]NHA69884.1 DUF2752 domain-containing protein [Phycicoccus flavus]